VTSPSPASGSTTAALVATQLSMDPGKPEVLDQLAATVAAVNALVTRMGSGPAEARTLGRHHARRPPLPPA
jgi:hypothetical protein